MVKKIRGMKTLKSEQIENNREQRTVISTNRFTFRLANDSYSRLVPL